MPAALVCFEDSGVDRLQPITLAKPAYAVTTAGFRLIDWLLSIGRSSGGRVLGHVRPHLRVIQRLDFGVGSLPRCFDDAGWEEFTDGLLLVNARLCPSVSLGRYLAEWMQQLAKDCRRENSAVIRDPNSDAVLIARIAGQDLLTLRNKKRAGEKEAGEKQAGQRQGKPDAIADLLSHAKNLPRDQTAAPPKAIDWFVHPHDVMRCHMKEMASSMGEKLRTGDYREVADGVFAGTGVTMGQQVVTDTSGGAILLGDGCHIGPLSYLSGPICVGPNAKISEHSAIKDAVCLGHTTKTGGEVEASIIEPYTNKQHAGFLGHSYLGGWINLGAGTCNSDLKNTYGKINADYAGQKTATGMQFLGCFIGDYTKTAINTSIFTGKVIGVCSMLYGFVTCSVPSYVNYTEMLGQTSPLPPEIMIKTQKRMFARRGVQQRPCDQQLIHDMHELTRAQRDGQPDLG